MAKAWLHTCNLPDARCPQPGKLRSEEFGDRVLSRHLWQIFVTEQDPPGPD